MTERTSIPATLAASVLLHLLGFLLLTRLAPQLSVSTAVMLPIKLIEAQLATPAPPAPEKIRSSEPAKVLAAQPIQQTKAETIQTDKPPQPPSAIRLQQETPLRSESKAAPNAAPAPVVGPARPEGGGSEAGSGVTSPKGDLGLVAAPGGAAGGGGTAIAGQGRGAGAPGLPGQGQPLRTNREAKPLQTVRAIYPAMALRAGLESDVTLRIEIDPQGNVTKAEIVKSGGGGFDDEALKAVKQSRFEPAQRDGQNVPAEFTYIYKFRLQR